MEVGSLSWDRQLKRFVKEYWPFSGNSNLAIVMSIFNEFSRFSHSGSGVNSGISMSLNAGLDSLPNSGNDVGTYRRENSQRTLCPLILSLITPLLNSSNSHDDRGIYVQSYWKESKSIT